MLWQNAYTIFFVCLFSGYLATLGFRVAIVVIALDLIYTALGGFYDVMDLTGWAMLLLPAISAVSAAAAAHWWRVTHPPKAAFVPPAPPPGRRGDGLEQGSVFHLDGPPRPSADSPKSGTN